ncbi:MAG: DUF86 domain-containing protein [Armatimonadetes bacterium]|nr:DUF86 domain-containing protein [Armatimonadota bacterium]
MSDERLYLIHMQECIERIEAYTVGGRDEFMRDTRTQDAVIRNLEIIGEAAKRVSQPTRDRAPDIPWRLVAGLRDVLIHQYGGLDLAEVWQIVVRDLPPLKTNLDELLGDLGGTEPNGTACHGGVCDAQHGTAEGAG